MVQAQRGVEGRAWREREQRSDRFGVLAADRIAGLGVEVLATPPVLASLQAHRQHVLDQWHRHRAEGRELACLAGRDGDRALELVARLDGDVVDGAGIGAAAVQRALRALDDLDPQRVVQRQAERARAQEQAVDEHRHRLRRLGPQRADAADDGAFGDTAEVGRIAQARREGGQVGEAGDAAIGQVLAGQCADRQRHVDDALVDAACGDDDGLGGLRFTAAATLRRGAARSECQRSQREHGSGLQGPLQLGRHGCSVVLVVCVGTRLTAGGEPSCPDKYP